MTGATDRIEWDVTGDGKTDVTCPGAKTTLSFRPATTGRRDAVAFDGTVTARAFGPGGASAALAQAIPVAAPVLGRRRRASAKRPVSEVVKAFEKEAAVFACGLGQDIAAAKAQLAPRPANGFGAAATLISQFACEDRTVVAGTLTVTGCLAPLRTAAQLPKAELGSLQPLLDIGRPPTRAEVLAGKEQPAGRFIEDALDFTDAWFSPGPVLINGVRYAPAKGARIVFFPQVKQIFSSDAAMSVGGIDLKHPGAFSISTAAKNVNGEVPLGTFERSGGIRALGDFALSGDVRVILTPGAGARIRTSLALPDFLDAFGVNTNNTVTFRMTPEGKMVLDDLHIGPVDAGIDPIGLNDLQLDYFGATDEWRGQGKLCAGFCLDATPVAGLAPAGGVVIRDGVPYVFARLEVPAPGVPIFPGAFLTSLGAGLALDPTRLLGSASVRAAGIFKINGSLGLAFPSAATPYILTDREVAGQVPGRVLRAPLHRRRRWCSRVPAPSTSRCSAIRTSPTPTCSTARRDTSPSAGASTPTSSIIQVKGGARGEINFANGKFDLAVDGEVCILDLDICAGAVGRVSDRGIGGCVTVFDYGFDDINIGGGVVFDPYEIKLWPFDGCRWTRFANRNVFGRAARQAGAPIRVEIAKGDPSRAITLEGAGGAPRVRVTTPGGQTFESSDGPGLGGTAGRAHPALRADQADGDRAGGPTGRYVRDRAAGRVAADRGVQHGRRSARREGRSEGEPSGQGRPAHADL